MLIDNVCEKNVSACLFSNSESPVRGYHFFMGRVKVYLNCQNKLYCHFDTSIVIT